jgi:enoyl-CoA hydratase/carnithine racemase
MLDAERHDTVEVWTLNRPDALNAFNQGLLRALAGALDRIEHDHDLRCVVVRGLGRAFSAGADLKERRTMPPDEVPAFVRLIGTTFDRVARARIPFIAAVDGFAFGGGLELALACDLRVVGAGASLGLTETRLAIIPGAGGTQRLARLVGLGRAKELIFTGRKIDAAEAVRIGLAEELADDGAALASALRIAQSIAAGGPVAVAAAKAAIDGGWHLPMHDALEWERRCYERTLPTEDRLEALAAFAERRPPVWKGR